MRYAFIIAILMSAPVVESNGLQGPASSTAADSPHVLYWPEKLGDPRQSVGLLYTPELLAALIARQSPETVPARISGAVQQQTPIVVMWTTPPMADSEPWSRPFSTSIVEGGDAFGGRLQIKPLWTLQNADELRALETPMLPYSEFQNANSTLIAPSYRSSCLTRRRACDIPYLYRSSESVLRGL